MYYDFDDKNIKINKKNWKKYLKDYGWVTMPIHWRRLLENTDFGILDCGSNGDCLFHVFAEGLNLNNILNGTLDSLLSETASTPTPEETFSANDPVNSFINRDYGPLMEAMEKKKEHFRP